MHFLISILIILVTVTILDIVSVPYTDDTTKKNYQLAAMVSYSQASYSIIQYHTCTRGASIFFYMYLLSSISGAPISD